MESFKEIIKKCTNKEILNKYNKIKTCINLYELNERRGYGQIFSFEHYKYLKELKKIIKQEVKDRINKEKK